MGERQGWLFEPTFNRSIKLREADERISDNAGTLLLREVDHRLGLTADLAARIVDPRDPARVRYTQTELLRQHLYALALGHVHQDDHDLLAHDVAMKLAVWDRPGKQVINERLASQPSDWRLVDRLSSRAPRAALRDALGESVARHQRAAGHGRQVVRGTIDIDPFPIEVHGNQPGGAWHGYYRQKMYSPLVASFCAEGDYQSSRLGEGFVHVILRRGAAGAEGAVRFTRETIRKSRELARHLDVRIDAGLVEARLTEKHVSRLMRYVHCRLLRVFFEPELRGMKDSDVSRQIESLANSQFDVVRPLYRINADARQIELHPRWVFYLNQNHAIVNGWAAWQWLKYMQARNPNVPNVAGKLFPPEQRQTLKRQSELWRLAIGHASIRCSYSNALLDPSDFELDHYVPWSFVAHDQMWNLAPAMSKANQSKGNAIPDKRYIRSFVQSHVQAMCIWRDRASQRDWNAVRAEYMSHLHVDEPDLWCPNALLGAYCRTIEPLIAMATSQGFGEGWVYRLAS